MHIEQSTRYRMSCTLRKTFGWRWLPNWIAEESKGYLTFLKIYKEKKIYKPVTFCTKVGKNWNIIKDILSSELKQADWG